MSLAGSSFSRRRPGSPWMPTPTSISSSGRSKPGLPADGVVQAVSATANEPLASLTRRPIAATSWTLPPSSASAPAIFSTNRVAPVPRRPAVQVESYKDQPTSILSVQSGRADAFFSSEAPLTYFVKQSGGALELAGTDGKFASAEAALDGDTIVVRSLAVSAPVAARYAWSAWPAGCNLYNAAGFPAAPFRTDR